MRIAVMGTSGSGKTTLCRALCEQFENHGLLQENFKEVIQSLTQINAATDSEKTKAILNFVDICERWLMHRNHELTQHANLIVDRTAVDILEIFLTTRLLSGNQKFYGKLVLETQKQLQLLDAIVFLPMTELSFRGGANEDQLERRTGIAEKLLAHSLKYGLVKTLAKTPFVEIAPENMSIEKRVSQVVSFFNRA